MRPGLLIAMLLAACGAPTTRTDDRLPDDSLGIYGAILAVGENWQLTGDPSTSAILIRMDDGTETSGTWVAPHYVEGRISASDISVALENTPCERNDVPYPMRATVAFPGHELTGCAAMRWDYRLYALIEEIDACIAAAPALRTVTFAGELPDGSTLVRLRDGDNFQDCRVKQGRATHAPRDESVVMATEGAAILLRARPNETQNPVGACDEAPEVVIYSGHPATGEMVGWMLNPMGC